MLTDPHPISPRQVIPRTGLGMVLFVAASVAGAQDAPPASVSPPLRGERFIDNGQIRLGVDLSLGGAITLLTAANEPNSPAADKTAPPNPASATPARSNLVNDWDLGRQIQLSFYSGPVPFVVGDKQPAPAWRGLGWNPIQAGDCFGHGSRTLDFQSDGKSLYLKCQPMQWPLDDVPGECTFESWLALDGAVVHARARLNNARADHRQYPARDQELPAVYTNGPLYRLMTYRGPRPFQNEPLERVEKLAGEPGPSAHWQATEHWAALVRDDDWGLGVWAPGCQRFIGGFAGKPGSGGAHDEPTGYLAPIQVETLDHNIQYEFEYVLIPGRLDEIRRYVYEHAPADEHAPAGEHAPSRALPDYRFAPIGSTGERLTPRTPVGRLEGCWRVRLDQDDPQLIGPADCWQAAAAPQLTIEASLRTGRAQSASLLAVLRRLGL